jgi:hypothetical protein
LEIAWERLFVEVGGGRVGRLVLGELEIKVGCGGKKKNSWKDGGSGGGSGSRREVASRTPSDQTTIGLVEIVAAVTIHELWSVVDSRKGKVERKLRLKV